MAYGVKPPALAEWIINLGRRGRPKNSAGNVEAARFWRRRSGFAGFSRHGATLAQGLAGFNSGV